MESLAYKGGLEFDEGVAISSLASHLAEGLRRAGAASVRATSTSVTFQGGVFRVSPLHMLFSFARGKLLVDASKHEVRFELSVVQMAVIPTLMLTWILVSAWPVVKRSPELLVFLALGWLWLFLPNVLLGARRFEEFLRQLVDSAPTTL